MSIKSKIQALIAAANATTGESDATLTDAVQTLVDGYGQGGASETVAAAIQAIPANAFTNAVLAEKLNFMRATSIGDRAFKGVTGLKKVAFPSVSSAATFILADSGSLNWADFGPGFQEIKGYYFSGQYNMNILVLRRTAVVNLQNNGFGYCSFASGGNGCTLYVPASLLESYRLATNWSTILGYANNSIKSIESTHTDPDAPIDLTQYYADGTPIT